MTAATLDAPFLPNKCELDDVIDLYVNVSSHQETPGEKENVSREESPLLGVLSASTQNMIQTLQQHCSKSGTRANPTPATPKRDGSGHQILPSLKFPAGMEAMRSPTAGRLHSGRGSRRDSKRRNEQQQQQQHGGSSNTEAANCAAFLDVMRRWDQTLKTMEGEGESEGGSEGSEAAACRDSKSSSAGNVDTAAAVTPTVPTPAAHTGGEAGAQDFQSPRTKSELKLLNQEMQAIKNGLESNLALVGVTLKQFSQFVRSQHSSQPQQPQPSALPFSPRPSPAAAAIRRSAVNTLSSSTQTQPADGCRSDDEELQPQGSPPACLARELASRRQAAVDAWVVEYEQRLQQLAGSLWNHDEEEGKSPAGRRATVEDISAILRQTVASLNHVKERSAPYSLWASFGIRANPSVEAAEEVCQLRLALERQQAANVDLSQQLVHARAESLELRRHLRQLVPLTARLQEDLRGARALGADLSGAHEECRGRLGRALATVGRLHEELFEHQKQLN